MNKFSFAIPKKQDTPNKLDAFLKQPKKQSKSKPYRFPQEKKKVRVVVEKPRVDDLSASQEEFRKRKRTQYAVTNEKLNLMEIQKRLNARRVNHMKKHRHCEALYKLDDTRLKVKEMLVDAKIAEENSQNYPFQPYINPKSKRLAEHIGGDVVSRNKKWLLQRNEKRERDKEELERTRRELEDAELMKATQVSEKLRNVKGKIRAYIGSEDEAEEKDILIREIGDDEAGLRADVLKKDTYDSNAHRYDDEEDYDEEEDDIDRSIGRLKELADNPEEKVNHNTKSLEYYSGTKDDDILIDALKPDLSEREKKFEVYNVTEETKQEEPASNDLLGLSLTNNKERQSNRENKEEQPDKEDKEELSDNDVFGVL